MPSSPGTEQTSRAFRNVLHLLTRQQWPPSSFWGTRAEGGAHQSTAPPGQSRAEGPDWPAGTAPRSAYQADAPDARVHGRALRRLRRPLAEEEVELVVVVLGAVGDELGVDEGRVCRWAGVSRAITTPSPHSPGSGPYHPGRHRAGKAPTPPRSPLSHRELY